MTAACFLPVQLLSAVEGARLVLRRCAVQGYGRIVAAGAAVI